MRKLILPILVIAMVLAMAGIAYAGSWWVEYGDDSRGTGGGRTPAPSAFPQLTSPPWGNPNTGANQGTPSPHLGFSTATNQCKTCHAVHLADATSYRLLHDISRMTECNWCHDASTGRSSHRPYGELTLQGKVVRGEHTLLVDVLIPDSTVNQNVWLPTTTPADHGRLPNRSVGDRTVSGNGLYCFDCHTVHGANRVSGWTTEIVRQDPAGNGGPDDTDQPGDQGKNAFCGDCHSLNPNWDANAADDVDIAGGGYANPRPNPRSHVQGPAANGEMEAYHNVIVDSWSSAYWANTTRADRIAGVRAGATPEQRFRNPRQGCRGCHSGSESLKTSYNNPGDWPHQTSGSKLLLDDYDGEMGVPAADPGNPDRPLKDLDKICLDCHRDPGTDMIGGTTDDVAGVGITF